MHDNELQHYGVKGMKWGVRKQIAKANKLERDANEIEDVARKIRAGKQNRYTTGKRYYNHKTKGANRREDIASAFELAGEMDRERAKQLRNKARGIGSTKVTKQVKDAGGSRFKKVTTASLIGGGVGTLAGPIANRVLAPLTGKVLTPFGAGLIGASIAGSMAVMNTRDR